MKKTILLLFAIFAHCTVWAQSIHLIPQPVEMQTKPGSFAIHAGTVVGYQQSAAKPVADMFAEKIARATGFELKKQRTGAIQFALNTKPDATLGKEGYTLDVNAKGVRVSANEAAGLFYGMQTLLQLFPPEIERSTPVKRRWALPYVHIKDYPRFAWRGLMLDVSRHFFSKDDVKRYIDRMARYKYNVFHWHLTDDNGWRLEIKSLPKLTSVGGCRVQRYGRFGDRDAPKPDEPATDCGFYTQEDVREIIAYARERHIEVMPEIDVPGHSMAAIAAYPEFSCTQSPVRVSPGHKFSEWYEDGTFKMLEDNTMNPADENVYALLDKVFGEVAALFSYPYIHVGGDECYMGYWEQNAACQALMKKENMTKAYQLHGYFMKRVEQIISAKGKKMIGWDEVLEGGVSPSVTVMSWRGIKGGIEAAHAGHNVVMASNDDVYIDLIQGDPVVEPEATAYKTVRLKRTYNFEPVPEGVDAKFILGGEACLWSEKTPTLRHAEYLSWPRAWATADIWWSPKGNKDWDNFVARMEHHFERSDQAAINYARSAYDPVVKSFMQGDQLMVEMSTEVNGLDIYYTLDGTHPDAFGPRYAQPIAIPQGSVTLRTISYRDGKPVGRMVVLPRETLKQRVGKK